MAKCAVPLLERCCFRFRNDRRKFPECMHSSDAPWAEHYFATVALPEVQVFDPLVPERATVDVALPAREVRELSRADFAPVLSRGTIAGIVVPRCLAYVRTSVG